MMGYQNVSGEGTNIPFKSRSLDIGQYDVQDLKVQNRKSLMQTS